MSRGGWHKQEEQACHPQHACCSLGITPTGKLTRPGFCSAAAGQWVRGRPWRLWRWLRRGRWRLRRWRLRRRRWPRVWRQGQRLWPRPREAPLSQPTQQEPQQEPHPQPEPQQERGATQRPERQPQQEQEPQPHQEPQQVRPGASVEAEGLACMQVTAHTAGVL